MFKITMKYRALNSTWIHKLYNTIPVVIFFDIAARRNASNGKTVGIEHVSSQGNNFTQK